MPKTQLSDPNHQRGGGNPLCGNRTSRKSGFPGISRGKPGDRIGGERHREITYASAVKNIMIFPVVFQRGCGFPAFVGKLAKPQFFTRENC